MPAIITSLLELAAQLSGVTNMIGALIAGLIAALLFAYYWHRGRKKEGKPGIEPMHLIIVGLAGIIIFATVLLVGVVMQMRRDGSPSAELQSQLSTLRADIDRLVMPREFTDEQATKIEEFLLQRPKQTLTVLYEPSNNEAQDFAARIYNAFRRAHWKVKLESLPHDVHINEGLSIRAKHPPDPEKGSSTALELLRRALDAANIEIRGSGSSVSNEVKEPELFLHVGHRPRR